MMQVVREQLWYSSENITNLDSVRADVEHADHAANEVADGFEVDAADAPGAVDQQHEVGLRCGLTLSVCGETVRRRKRKGRVSETPGTPQTPTTSVRSLLHELFEVSVCGEKCGKKGERKLCGYIREEREVRSTAQDSHSHKWKMFTQHNVLQALCNTNNSHS